MLIQAYKTHWVADFDAIKKILHEALANLNISIEHVGSTSIPQLAAKSIIDIDIVFGEEVEFEQIKTRLEQIGYHHNGNQGIHDREVFKRSKMAVPHEVLDFTPHHLYACPVDSEELSRHILFRNYLLAHEEARIQYQNLKYELAEEAHQDRKKYAELKEIKARAFIHSILDKAKDKAKMRKE